MDFSGQAQRAFTSILIRERQWDPGTQRKGDVKTRCRQRPERCGCKPRTARSQQEPGEARSHFSPGASRGRAALLIP